MSLRIDFGRAVKSLRKEKGFSQEELAERAGLHRTYIGMIERGEKNLTLENIGKIAQSLNIPIEDIFIFIRLKNES